MKRFIAIILILTAILPFAPIFPQAEEMPHIFTSNINVSSDGTILTAVFDLPLDSSGTYYLFRVTPDNETIQNSTPISEAKSENGKAIFELEYDMNDHSSVLYGYVLAVKASKGYSALTNARYINNISAISHNARPFPTATTIKGLEVQYIADAQLLGVGHTVIHVKFNDLITHESDESTAFVYGSNRYFLNTEALTLLDYRVKTLSDAGINVYIDYVLSFDANADKSLYYDEANGAANTLFAPNMSNFESASTFSAVMHFLSERYSYDDAKYGFCGSYILGYEVNNTHDNHNSGMKELSLHAKEYASYLRFADLAVRSAYSEARIYASVSNVWNAKESETVGIFGAKDLLTEVAALIPDVGFGIAINPYPSELSNNTYWNDKKATNALDTEYLTMKNLSVLGEFLSQNEMQYNAMTRSVVISEFGLSGVYGEESETTQAAGYAYAYYTAAKLPFVEAFIWHRHVDHNYELNLSYGLYSSTELTLDGKNKKLIHNVFTAVDSSDSASVKTVKAICSMLPVKDYDELIKGGEKPNRLIYSIKSVSTDIDGAFWEVDTLYDFTKALYSFYPSDNASYIEHLKQGKSKFMRIAALRVSPIEYMGAGVNMTDGINLSDTKYITVRVRVNSVDEKAEFALVISGNAGSKPITLQCTSSVKTNTWVTLKFPISQLDAAKINNVRLKLWARSESAKEEQVFIDVSSIKLHSSRNIVPFVVIIVIISLALLCGCGAAIYVYVYKKKASTQR